MVGSLLLRGMIVGLLAGLLAFGFARVFGEPAVDYAIGFEGQRAAAAGEMPEPEIVSRATQAGIGLLTGILVYGAAIGGLCALAFAVAHGRLGRLGPRGVSLLVALAGFAALVLVPQLKYPANPPAVGSPETIAIRTELFFAMILASVAAVAAGLWVLNRLAKSHGVWNAAIAGFATFLAVVAVAAMALPAINEVPEGFSGTVLWRFRVASLGVHVVLWAGIGLGFGAWAERTIAARLAPRRALPAGTP